MKQKSRTLISCTVLVVAVIGFILNSESAEKTKIGIMEFDVAKNLNPALSGFLYDMLLERMVDSGKYTVVDWEEIDRVLKYISQSQPNISDEDARKQAGDQLGIEKMYLGSLSKVGSKYYVSVKVLNLDLTVSRAVRESTRSEDELENVINSLASKLMLSPEELAEAKQKAEFKPIVSSSKGRLYVRTTPADARVRILNIKPRYRDGIELDPGDYHIDVSKRGFARQERWITVSSGEEKEIEIQLAATESAPKAGESWREPYTGIQFVWIPGGCFTMGSPEGEAGRNKDESPEHSVCVDGFWMGKMEVTNQQYRKVVSGHRSGSYRGHSLNSDKRPVVRVSWFDARAFGTWLTQRHRGQHKFRLPSEAEWEYACRAGRQASRFWGNSSDNACRFANVMGPVAQKAFAAKSNHSCEDEFMVTAPVGRFQPNGLRLYDMLGNVMEWCEDIYAMDAYTTHSYRNPKYTGNGSERVIRGGSWSCGPVKVRSAYRDRDKPGNRFPDVGFRLVKIP